MKISAFLIAAGAVFAQCSTAQEAREAGIRAFREVAAVLTSPRCLNCHVPGNSPLQGDDNHVHNMMVARGADDKGTPAMRCSNCHQESNVSTPHAPPGAGEWRIPAAATPMEWQGLTSTQLCRVLVDPATNGKRSLADLVEHVASDKIVN
jgi:hypothetical protein